MGQVLEFHKVRVNRTGERFIRALYFVEKGIPIPNDAAVRVGAKMGLRANDADTITIARAMKAFPDWRDGSVENAFSYLATFGDVGSAWLMLLYDFFFWFGTVDLRGLAR
jgi:hypothetical protein